MINFFPNAGKGTKITAKFKSKIFSFGDVLVDHNKLTLYQISEPLQPTSSATPSDPAPYGTDINGKPLNDPIPDTEVDPSTGQVVSTPATGTAALLDKWTVTKPEVNNSVFAKLSAPNNIKSGEVLTYMLSIRNRSEYSLNGTQVRFSLPRGLTFAGTPSGTVTVQGNDVIVTVGRLATGSEQTVELPTLVSSDVRGFELIETHARVSSSTALPIDSNPVITIVVR
jgi:uncharacterized repeat protein (TIGR01451 family)